ncbi:hypothetical protein [Moheibacter sediminis]|uniref:Uncharacterized protein n=1 Tax=Moheibacter sediminis TaxID=1434700 RepID=A0A1W2CTE9_9FLAO|nr:hypothetical protein [Moheibacter sediminis]SMC88517.1 hypothetical protein SAMN06296427_11146 [Moheibacter sediminis]
MKTITIFIISLILINCSSKEEESSETKYFPTKDRFILSEYERYWESKGMRVINIDNVYILEDSLLNPNYVRGFTHILIVDSDKMYFHQAKQVNQGWGCGIPIEVKSKNIDYAKRLDSLTVLKPDDIHDLLIKNQSAFISNDSVILIGNISIALKNDTLNGTFFYKILNLLKENKTLIIRRMNSDEIKAIEKFNNN